MLISEQFDTFIGEPSISNGEEKVSRVLTFKHSGACSWTCFLSNSHDFSKNLKKLFDDRMIFDTMWLPRVLCSVFD